MHGHIFGKTFRLPGWVGVGALTLFSLLSPVRESRAAALAATHLVSEAGRPISFDVALNEISVRPPGAGSRPQEVPGLATAEAVRLHAQLLAQTTGQEVELVLYETGKPRDQFTRRLLTRQVLVHLAPGMDAVALATAHGAVSKGGLSHSPGYFVLESPIVGGALDLATALQGSPGVHSVEPLLARQWAKFFVPNDTLFTNQWHLVNTGQNGARLGLDINVTNVWDNFRGRGVTIAIVDDSLQGAHPDLTNNYNFSLGLDVNDGDFDPSPVVTADFHGTAVAGVAAARGDNNLGGAGVAFEATLAGIRFLGGPATSVQIAQCLTHSNQVISVYNNSWGFSIGGQGLGVVPTVMSNALVQGVTLGRGGRGSIFVFAAGNSGAQGDDANYSQLVNSIYTIGVGALNDRFARASYGNPGAALVISAPAGNDATRPQGTTTTDLVGVDGYNDGTSPNPLQYADPDYTAEFNGTSSASPVVSGVVALMLQANPNLGWRDVQEILIRSATVNLPNAPGWVTNAAGNHFNHEFGAGLVNAGGAVTLATNWINLGPQLNYAVQQNNLALAIPDNSTNGVVYTIPVTGSNLRLEHVNLLVDIQHQRRGDLEISLTSPSGITSRLANPHGDVNPDYPNWTFMTVHNWGEIGDGNWVVRVNDRTPTVGGILNSLRLEMFGTFTNINQVPTNPPTITTHPRSRTVTQGSTLNFSVGLATNTTTPIAYQWRYNGENIFGAVGPILVLTNVQGSAGGLYSVRVSNPVATNFSSDAALVVTAPPAVLTQPTNQSAIVGSNVTFIVSVSGAEPFNYQWRRDGVPITDATNAALNLNAVQFNQAGLYDVRVSNVFASIFSAGAALTVVPPFTLSPQPQSLVTNAGITATLTVGATGVGGFPGPFTYQWTFNGSSLTGQTGASLILTSLNLTNSGNYACVVTSPLGALTSSNANLTVFNPFTVGPASFRLGGLFQMVATGDNGRSYRLESSTNLVTWVPVVTNAVSGGVATFTDTAASGKALRFYRIVLLP
ncbi:MAG: hypothetical protein RL514_3985 [Verrucomicrobiota bacterium]|jgi:subtilisin-like proprotein convertase family protein